MAARNGETARSLEADIRRLARNIESCLLVVVRRAPPRLATTITERLAEDKRHLSWARDDVRAWTIFSAILPGYMRSGA